MKKSLYLIFFVVQLSYAQNAKIDSLKALLPLSQGVERIDVLTELAKAFATIDNKAAYEYGGESFKKAVSAGDSLRIVNAGKTFMKALLGFEKYDSVLIIGNYCEEIFSRNNHIKKLHEGSVLTSSGAAYLYISKYDQALSSFLRSLSVYKEKNDKRRMSIALNNIGFAYYKLGDYGLALSYFEKCQLLKHTINDDYDLDKLLTNMSLCDSYLGNQQRGRKILQVVIDKCTSKCTDYTVVSAFFTSGIIWYKSDSLGEAEQDFITSYRTARKIEDHRFMLENIIYLSKIYIRLGKLSKAEQFLREGEVIANNTLLDLEEMKIYEELSALYKAKGDSRKLSFYQTKYIQMSDSIYNEAQTNNLMRLHAEATEKEYKTQLTSQERTLQLKDEIINKQLGINVLIGLALILLAILVYVLVRIFNDHRLSNIVLIKKVNDRTVDIEHNRHDLLFAIEQDKALTHWRNTLDISVNAVQELCSTAMSAELNSDGLKYFNEINGVASKISKSLESIQLVSELGESN